MIASCITCQRTKYPNRHYAGERKAIIPTKANELVALDLYGPLPKTKYGFKHLFVCVDVFSKFVQVYCINRPNSKNCIHQLDKFFRKAGEYEKVLTDNGPQFTSECWSRAMEEKNIIHILASIRHPQSNPSERIMRELSRLFRVYCHQRHTDWYLLVPYINNWLNEVHHDSIKTTPMRLISRRSLPMFYNSCADPKLSL